MSEVEYIGYDCKCWLKAGVETRMVSSQYAYDNESGEWVIMRGFIERCKQCKSILGVGYGDVDFVESEESAKECVDKDKETFDKWI